MLQYIFIFSFITALLILYPILKYSISKHNSVLRIKKYIHTDLMRDEKKKASRREYKTGLNILARSVGSVKFLDGYKKAVQNKLTRAHILLRAEEFITICIILFIAVGLAASAVLRSLPFGFAVGIVGWIIPSLLVKVKIKRRIKNLNDQICDAIVLISNSLKAGYSFFQSVDIVSREMTGPIAEEFLLMQKEINLGLTTEKALENLVDRVSSDDLELIVTAVLIQRQVGGNLAEVLDNISSTIRERIKIKGEVKTVTAQGRMSGLIISLLPVVLGLILLLINPEHIYILFTEPLGIAILVFSVFMELIGLYFINKIVKIGI